VRVRYGDKALYSLAVDIEFQPVQWAPALVSSYRRRLQSLVAAKDRDDLGRVMSLDMKPENGHDGARSSIGLIDRSRLLLDFGVLETDQVTVVGIVEANTREVAP
jgi:hypothetical protein